MKATLFVVQPGLSYSLQIWDKDSWQVRASLGWNFKPLATRIHRYLFNLSIFMCAKWRTFSFILTVFWWVFKLSAIFLLTNYLLLSQMLTFAFKMTSNWSIICAFFFCVKPRSVNDSLKNNFALESVVFARWKTKGKSGPFTITTWCWIGHQGVLQSSGWSGVVCGRRPELLKKANSC